jgi:hypothetical protein
MSYLKKDFNNSDLWRIYDGIVNGGSGSDIAPLMTDLNDVSAFLDNDDVSVFKSGEQISVFKNEANESVFLNPLTGKSSLEATTLVSVIAFINNLVAKVGACELHGITGYNNSDTAQFIQVFDLAALPADGETPKIILQADPKSNFSYTGVKGVKFTNGIVICNSSTPESKTIGANDCWFNATVK